MNVKLPPRSLRPGALTTLPTRANIPVGGPMHRQVPQRANGLPYGKTDSRRNDRVGLRFDEDLYFEPSPVGRKRLMVANDRDSRQGMGKAISGLLAGFQSGLRSIVDGLAHRGVKPNHITLSALGLSGAMAATLFYFPNSTAALVALPIVFGARLLLDITDGMLAREHRLSSATGAFLNEVEYIGSDALLYLPLALVSGVDPALVYWLTGSAVATEVVGMGGYAFGGKRRNDGPAGKFLRGLVITCAAAALGLGALSAAAFNNILLAVLIALPLTALNRIVNMITKRSTVEGISDRGERLELYQGALRRAARTLLHSNPDTKIGYVDLFAGNGIASIRFVEDMVLETNGDIDRSGAPDLGKLLPAIVRIKIREKKDDALDVLHERRLANVVVLEWGRPFANLSQLPATTNLVSLGNYFDVVPEDEAKLRPDLEALYRAMPEGAYLVFSGVHKPSRGFYRGHNAYRLEMDGKVPGRVDAPARPQRRIPTLMQEIGFVPVKVDATQNGVFHVALMQKPLAGDRV